MEANGGNSTSSRTASFVIFTHFSHSFEVGNNDDSRTKHFLIKSQTAITASSRFSIVNDLEASNGWETRKRGIKKVFVENQLSFTDVFFSFFPQLALFISM
jgi:hypothetical protein